MADSTDSFSIDMNTSCFHDGKEHLVKTANGFISVAIFGDPDKPALVTYPDLALNYMSCFQGLFLCPEAFSLLLHNFCIYHINPPGHEWGAAPMSYDDQALSADDLADQVAEVLDYLGLGAVMCLGVTAGAYVVTLFAMKYTQRVVGLILISPFCKTPSSLEWLCNKVMSNVLYYYGTCALLKELLLMCYFSKEVRGGSIVREVVESCRRFSALIEIGRCGSVVTEEQPYSMLMPLEYFLMGYGVYRPSQLNISPRSPLSPTSLYKEREKIIVYNCSERGRLDQYIRHGNTTTTTLTWLQRLEICAGACFAVDHTHKRFDMCYGNFESPKILLDNNWVAEVTDFWICKSSPTYGVPYDPGGRGSDGVVKLAENSRTSFFKKGRMMQTG